MKTIVAALRQVTVSKFMVQADVYEDREDNVILINTNRWEVDDTLVDPVEFVRVRDEDLLNGKALVMSYDTYLAFKDLGADLDGVPDLSKSFINHITRLRNVTV